MSFLNHPWLSMSPDIERLHSRGVFVLRKHSDPLQTRLRDFNFISVVGDELEPYRKIFLRDMNLMNGSNNNNRAMKDILRALSAQQDWTVATLAERLLDLCLAKPMKAMLERSPLVIKSCSPSIQNWPTAPFYLEVWAASFPVPKFYWSYLECQSPSAHNGVTTNPLSQLAEVHSSRWHPVPESSRVLVQTQERRGYRSQILVKHHTIRAHADSSDERDSSECSPMCSMCRYRVYKCQVVQESSDSPIALTRFFCLMPHTSVNSQPASLTVSPLVRKLALLISASNYKGDDLPGARQEATRLPDHLKERGFEVVSLHNLTRCEILAVLKRASQFANSRESVLLVYISGHGVFCDQNPTFYTADKETSCAIHPTPLSGEPLPQCPTFTSDTQFSSKYLVSLKEIHNNLQGNYILFLDMCESEHDLTYNHAQRLNAATSTETGVANENPQSSQRAIRDDCIVVLAARPFTDAKEWDYDKLPRYANEVTSRSELSDNLRHLMERWDSKSLECHLQSLMTETQVWFGASPTSEPIQRLLQMPLFQASQFMGKDDLWLETANHCGMENHFHLMSELNSTNGHIHLQWHHYFSKEDSVSCQNYLFLRLNDGYRVKCEELTAAFSSALLKVRNIDSTWCDQFSVCNFHRKLRVNLESHFYIYCTDPSILAEVHGIERNHIGPEDDEAMKVVKVCWNEAKILKTFVVSQKDSS